ncbi:uncharacterized protein [Rutidosis leptorrhynchoides]|uniref:uncharacterized protein n=1 Tax=Rutidosis leptorrhynchoides TaxID=125765 RepID=UPI003A9964B0
MACMGFGEKWRKWILACLKSASISILVNGSLTREFAIGRGVRQGDPLSPFLFILAAEGLKILTKAAVERGLFNGVEIGRDKIILSHLQITDDTLFLGDWSRLNSRNLINILKCFELTSSLKINFSKSCLYGVGVSSIEIEELARRMGCRASNFSFIYLGLPISVKMKKWWWRFYTEISCFWAKIIRSVYGIDGGLRSGDVLARLSTSGVWNNIIFAGNQIEELQGPFKNSFKKAIGDGRFTTFWNEVWCGSNCFKNMFPRIYMLETNKEATIRDRIIPLTTHRSVFRDNLAAAAPSGRGSRSVHATAAPTGGGSSPGFAAAADPPGLPSASNFKIAASRHVSGQSDPLPATEGCSFLFAWEWARDPTGRTMDELKEISNLIRGISINFNSQELCRWMFANNGVFTVKKLSSIINNKFLSNNSQVANATLRNNHVPKKIENFVCRALKKRIPVRIELDKRGIDLHSLRCPVCDDGLESVDHLLIECKFSLDVWSRVCKWWNFSSYSHLNFAEFLHGKCSIDTSSLGSKVWQAVEWICVYYLWKNRNKLVFNNISSIVPMLVSKIQVKSFEWISHPLKGICIELHNWLTKSSVYLDN